MIELHFLLIARNQFTKIYLSNYLTSFYYRSKNLQKITELSNLEKFENLESLDLYLQ